MRDLGFLAESAPELDLPSITDMHQVLPAGDGMLDFQLAMMERLGVARALLQSVPPEVPSLSGDEKLREAAHSFPERFWVSQYLDPREPEAIPRVAAHAESGVRVIKLLPPVGWEADDPELRPFWNAMDRHHMVAMTHTGFITARHKQEERAQGRYLNSRYARPVFLDEPARRFPNVTFILCHLGDAAWCEEAAQLVTQHPNVWADVSGFGLFALRRLLNGALPVDWTKVMWGNDAPAYAYPFNLRLLVQCLDAAGARPLLPYLLHQNAQEFACRHLS